MQVEIFDMLELDENLNYEPDAESVALIEELGLSGQKEMVNDEGKREPYQKLTADQAMIFSTLFPSFCKIDEYSEGPIPYRVLKEAKQAREHFKYLYVLYDTPAEIKDPVLVGCNQEMYLYSHNNIEGVYSKSSLIARWGDALESFDVLKERALAIREKVSIHKFEEMMAYFEGIKKGIKDGNIKTNFHLNLKKIVEEVLPGKTDGLPF